MHDDKCNCSHGDHGEMWWSEGHKMPLPILKMKKKMLEAKLDMINELLAEAEKESK